MNKETPMPSIQLGLEHHQAGRLPEAEAIYRQILAVVPNHVDALHLLGILANQTGNCQAAFELISKALEVAPNGMMYFNLGISLQALGRLDAAIECFHKAIAMTPDLLEAHFNLGNALHAQGKLDEAIERFRLVIATRPDFVEAHINLAHVFGEQAEFEAAAESYSKALALQPDLVEVRINLGNIFQSQRKFDAAVACYQQALVLRPDMPIVHNNLGNAFKEQGNVVAAVASYRRALVLQSDFSEGHSNLGVVLEMQGKWEEALESYASALALNPKNAAAHNNLGIVLQAQGKTTEAIESYQRAIALEPNYADAYTNVGNALQSQGLLDAAIESHHKALSIRPDFAPAYSSLGNIFLGQGKIEAALECYRRALHLSPDFAQAHNNLGYALQTQGQMEAALGYYRQALQLKPDFFDAHSNLIFALDLAVDADTAVLQKERKRWDEAHAAPLAILQRPHINQVDPERRLRIGYVSADFRDHSAIAVFGCMLVNFDRTKYDVFAYSNTKKEDRQTEQFVRSVTCWRNIVSMSDDAVADLIRQDEIDILVDLSGHSANNRLLVFARKPAPLQITAWGYATSTGMQAMDVFFADAVVVPPEERALYTEQVRYLPNIVGSFFPRKFPEVSALTASVAGGITFGSFNRLGKVSEAVFKVWAQVLLAVPNSKMILKTGELDGQSIRDRVLGYFTKEGIDSGRIILLGRTSWEAHMAAFNQVDIALDPFPHGGGVTTVEGIMMGVPVVTLRWNTIVGRLSASILTTLGLTDWIAETSEQYVQIAVQKARDLNALAELRTQLRSKLLSSVIGDAQSYVAAVEHEYRQLWREWCERQEVMDGIANPVMLSSGQPSL